MFKIPLLLQFSLSLPLMVRTPSTPPMILILSPYGQETFNSSNAPYPCLLLMVRSSFITDPRAATRPLSEHLEMLLCHFMTTCRRFLAWTASAAFSYPKTKCFLYSFLEQDYLHFLQGSVNTSYPGRFRTRRNAERNRRALI